MKMNNKMCEFPFEKHLYEDQTLIYNHRNYLLRSQFIGCYSKKINVDMYVIFLE